MAALQRRAGARYLQTKRLHHKNSCLLKELGQCAVCQWACGDGTRMVRFETGGNLESWGQCSRGQATGRSPRDSAWNGDGPGRVERGQGILVHSVPWPPYCRNGSARPGVDREGACRDAVLADVEVCGRSYLRHEPMVLHGLEMGAQARGLVAGGEVGQWACVPYHLCGVFPPSRVMRSDA